MLAGQQKELSVKRASTVIGQTTTEGKEGADMNILESVVLGAVQGLAEFLPISSSGHLVLMKEIMDLRDVPLLYDVLLHVSTLLVVVIVFRKRLVSICTSLFRCLKGTKSEEDAANIRLTWVLLIATVITVGIAVPVSMLEPEKNIRLVSILFIVTAAVLAGTRLVKGKKGYGEIGLKEAFITGIAQGAGVFPGISRSGITISASLYSGMSREKAGEYAFLLSIPAVLGALIFTLKDAESLNTVMPPAALAAGLIASFIVGAASLLLLLRLIKKGSLYFFSFYLLPLGIIGLVLL